MDLKFLLLLSQSPEGMENLFRVLKGALYQVGEFLSHYFLGGMVPAFFIAGAIGSFISKEFILKYLGRDASPFLSYPVSCLAGGILSVCSCGIIPIFIRIYSTGAGVGPAVTFLFAGPAINLVAILWTQAVIGTEMMIVRSVAACVGALMCGWLFARIFSEPPQEEAVTLVMKTREIRTGIQTAGFIGLLVLWMFLASNPGGGLARVLQVVLVLLNLITLAVLAKKWLTPAEIEGWLDKTWMLFKRIMPKIVLGIFLTHVLLEMYRAEAQIIWIMGKSPLWANFFTSLIGSFVYFGTIIGVNIVHTFMGWGLTHGPALALFLAGPVVSLPSLLAINEVLSWQRTLVYWLLVVFISTFMGTFYSICGPFFPGP